MADHSWLASLGIALGLRKVSKDVAHDVADEIEFRRRFGMSRRADRRNGIVGVLLIAVMLLGLAGWYVYAWATGMF